MASARPKSSVRQANKKKAQECQCLLCEGEVAKRGLCAKHYSRYRVARNELPIDQRLLFDIKLIKSGKLQQSRQGQRLDLINEFRGSRG